MKIILFVRILSFLLAGNIASVAIAQNLADTVTNIKSSVVGVGVVAPLATISSQLHGTGFVIGNGKYVVTNEHVIKTELEEGIKSQRVIFIPSGKRSVAIPIKNIYYHGQQDIAILEIEKTLTPVSLRDPESVVRDGESIAITGFPIGAVLGLFPATHAGIVAAFTPNIRPAQHSSQLSLQYLQRVGDPIFVYQLDIVAYPGNSGSPVYLRDSGQVIGVINQVYVKDTKESAITAPSGITYAVPIKYVYELAQRHQIEL